MEGIVSAPGSILSPLLGSSQTRALAYLWVSFHGHPVCLARGPQQDQPSTVYRRETWSPGQDTYSQVTLPAITRKPDRPFLGVRTAGTHPLQVNTFVTSKSKFKGPAKALMGEWGQLGSPGIQVERQKLQQLH